MKWPFRIPWRRQDHFEGILELFDDHVHVGEVTLDGRYVSRFSGPTINRFTGAAEDDGRTSVELWDACVYPLDRSTYMRFWGELLAGKSAQVTYRMLGLDGVVRTVWHRARSRALAGGGLLVQGLVSDVTKHEETATRLAEADDRFMHLLDVVGEHVYRAIAHRDGRIEELFQGPGADRLLGGADPDSEMENWNAAIHPDDRPAIDAFEAALADGQDAGVEYRLRGYDGVTRWVHDRAVARRRDDGVVEVSGIVSDITARRRMEDELREAHRAAEELATTDELTGVLNRRHFTKLAAEALAADAEACGLLLIDADHFKRINDVYGHVIGDHVLVELARRVRGALGIADVLARWGGEEFAVLVHGVDSGDALARRAYQLLDAVAVTPFVVRDLELTLTISIGGIHAKADLATLDALIEHADRHLYAAKRDGRNRAWVPHDAEPAFTTRLDPR
ncbi:sensor domain-containing diguanylate cyclase [Solirubrobacter soli]|uniref:sensor domain-containing diguanylate cyclase n=1 Tax=Solirubrobacter soli TaxID=363832 RepID=UPI0003FE9EC2|nr:sensor domain-containing diguanylate cyclase [Solirubrobacter soli]